MAHLGGDDRGQIILVAAFILAVSFVVLALVVNSAIFTENLATRGDVPGSADALEHRHEVERGVGAIVASTNANNNTAETYLTENATEGVENVSLMSGSQQSSLGRIANVTYKDETMGYRIAQDNSTDRAFTSNQTASDWELAQNVDSTRNFQMRINRTASSFGSGFVVDLNDSTESWNMTVSEPTTDTLRVEVEHPATSARRCDRDVTGQQNVTIDVTDGVVAGEPCPALTRASDGTAMWFGEGLASAYTIEFQNGNEVAGTYSMVLDVSGTDIDPQAATHLEELGQDEDSNDPPYYTDALYSVVVTYEYRTHAVAYETDVDVAPGETES